MRKQKPDTKPEAPKFISDIEGCFNNRDANWIKRKVLEFVCPRTWDNLQETDDPKQRFCTTCGENVTLVETRKDLSTMGRYCVAIKMLKTNKVSGVTWLTGSPRSKD